MSPDPHPDEASRVDLDRLLGLLAHASCYLERKKLGAVAEALADAVKRTHSLLDEVRSRS